MKDPINELVLTKSILHGRDLCYNVMQYYDFNLPEVKVSSDVSIITVMDKVTVNYSSLIKSNISNNKVNIILVNKFIKWISKIEGILNYIADNYNSLANYILYLDGTDTLIINDVLNPQDILDYYNCKILFNSEPDFWHTGTEAPADIKTYYDPLYQEAKSEYLKKSAYKYSFKEPHNHSLNAGAFLGEKDYVLELITEIYNLMVDDFTKGFPHGTTDDQSCLKFLHNKYFDKISIDLFHNVMLWGTKDALSIETNLFSPNYLESERINYKSEKI